MGDSKRAMDEYTSEIMMGGINTIALHNTCEVSVSLKPEKRLISGSVKTACSWLNTKYRAALADSLCKRWPKSV